MCQTPRRKSTFMVKNEVSELYNLESIKTLHII